MSNENLEFRRFLNIYVQTGSGSHQNTRIRIFNTAKSATNQKRGRETRPVDFIRGFGSSKYLTKLQLCFFEF